MTKSTYELSRSPARVEVLQFGVGTIVLMFAWADSPNGSSHTDLRG